MAACFSLCFSLTKGPGCWLCGGGHRKADNMISVLFSVFQELSFQVKERFG